MKEEIVTIKVYKSTRDALNMLAAFKKKQQIDITGMLADRELKKYFPKEKNK